MSLIYIFTFSKVETEQVARLMDVAVNGKPPARTGPSRVGTNDLLLFASDMGPKIARSLAKSVLNDGAQAEAAGLDQNPNQRKSKRNFIADHLRAGPQSAQQRVFIVR